MASTIHPIKRNDLLIFIGSCFSKEIGGWLQTNKLPVTVNPLGIVYNSYTISQQFFVDHDKDNHDKDKEAIFQNGDIWLSWDFHSSIWAETKESLFDQIKDKKTSLQEDVLKCHWVFITLGTAWFYRHITLGRIVANCHKIPQKEFVKNKFSVQEVVDHLHPVIQQIFSLNPNLKVVFTVSPVRHIKDGLIENQRSKATLLLAVEQLIELDQRVSYFPAYEMMMDDLRDYRYYQTDLIHPSVSAIDYIREVFRKTYLSEEVSKQISRIRNLHSLLRHRILHPTPSRLREHSEKCWATLLKCQQSYPELDWSYELSLLHKMKE